MQERLDKFLSTQKGITRSEARRFVNIGKVTVNGAVIRKPDHKINPETTEVTLNGENLCYKEHIYIMLNKPKGVLSAATDKSRKTVVDLVPSHLSRRELFPVGRLDKDTTGLLIITDDGDFAHRVISPKSGLDKHYIAQLDGNLTDNIVKSFKEGIVLADGTRCLPAELHYNKLNPNVAYVTVQEGKYHQIKRMFGTVGLGVNELHRESIGGVSLDPSLPAGECRELTKEELHKITIQLQKNQ